MNLLHSFQSKRVQTWLLSWLVQTWPLNWLAQTWPLNWLVETSLLSWLVQTWLFSWLMTVELIGSDLTVQLIDELIGSDLTVEVIDDCWVDWFRPDCWVDWWLLSWLVQTWLLSWLVQTRWVDWIRPDCWVDWCRPDCWVDWCRPDCGAWCVQELLVSQNDLGRDYEHCLELQKKVNNQESAVSSSTLLLGLIGSPTSGWDFVIETVFLLRDVVFPATWPAVQWPQGICCRLQPCWFTRGLVRFCDWNCFPA